MALGVSCYSLALLFVSAAAASDPQANLSSGSVPIVQPGAPGHSSKTIAASAVVDAPRKPLEADISFMQGMIHHHSQAVANHDAGRISHYSVAAACFIVQSPSPSKIVPNPIQPESTTLNSSA